jgi:membrane-anchored protein YejM (alkaline phosphatase superfamily)
LYIKDADGMSRDIRKASIQAINSLNEESHKMYNDPEILSRIAQYEMAYKMQISVPEVMNINDEPPSMHEMYGTQPGKACFANNVLLARKLVEKGVRFVQLFDWGWDTHGDSASNAVNIGLKDKCKTVDKPIAALIKDLKQRGLFEETLIVWGSEFGRTPMQENREGKQMNYKGRDHHGAAFNMWMAGGGIQGGTSYGETDEIGYDIINGKTEAFDIQATMMHLLGFDHEKFTYEWQGRPFRLTDVAGKVIHEILV